METIGVSNALTRRAFSAAFYRRMADFREAFFRKVLPPRMLSPLASISNPLLHHRNDLALLLADIVRRFLDRFFEPGNQ